MPNYNEISTDKKAIDRYINKWRTNHPSIIKIKQTEEEYNQIKSQYEDAYKTYMQNIKTKAWSKRSLKICVVVRTP